MQQTIWTPNLESSAAKAFMATLRLHSAAWQWAAQPEHARWWVIDATTAPDLMSLAQQYDALSSKPQVAFLATQMSLSPRPAWAFFKPPVPSGLIFNWIRPATNRQSAATVPPLATAPGSASTATAIPHTPQTASTLPWHQGVLRLRRWPNVSRYGNVLELTVACSRLLAEPASYQQLLQWQIPAPLLDRFLADTYQQDLLILEPGPSTQADHLAAQAVHPVAPIASAHHNRLSVLPVLPSQPTAAQGASEHSRWDLVKRLLGRFARA